MDELVASDDSISAEAKRFYHNPQENELLEEIEEIIEAKDAENTKKSTKAAVKCFKDFLREVGENEQFEDLGSEDLDKLLQKFYHGARKTNGELFKKTAMQGIRYGLNRYTKDAMSFDIIHDVAFRKSGRVFRAVSVDLKRKGLGQVKHHKPVSVADMTKMYHRNTNVLTLDTPQGLQRKVWFETMLFLCCRGRDKLRMMTRNSLRVATDERGRRYVYHHAEEEDEAVTPETEYPSGRGKMYEIPGSDLCPLKSFAKYISRLHPECNEMWQRPRHSFQFTDSVWYHNAPLGKNSLAGMMLGISTNAKLSHPYTNNSVRVTNISVIEHAHAGLQADGNTTSDLSETGFSVRSDRKMKCKIKKRSQELIKETSQNEVQKQQASLSQQLRQKSDQNAECTTNTLTIEPSTQQPRVQVSANIQLPISTNHQTLLLRQQLEQQRQETEVAYDKINRLTVLLAKETEGRLQAQTRMEQMMKQNGKLLAHMSTLAAQIQVLEMKLMAVPVTNGNAPQQMRMTIPVTNGKASQQMHMTIPVTNGNAPQQMRMTIPVTNGNASQQMHMTIPVTNGNASQQVVMMPAQTSTTSQTAPLNVPVQQLPLSLLQSHAGRVSLPKLTARPAQNHNLRFLLPKPSSVQVPVCQNACLSDATAGCDSEASDQQGSSEYENVTIKTEPSDTSDSGMNESSLGSFDFTVVKREEESSSESMNGCEDQEQR